ncbi:MAG: glutamate 5-kinase [Planctomycetota bacterium]
MTDVRLPTDARTITVVKVGSAVIAPGACLDPARVRAIVAGIAERLDAGDAVCLVSSGAVACGLEPIGLTAMPAAIVDRQAAAAVGQQRLVRAWADAFEAHHRVVAQVLLTEDDLDDRARFLNARRTIESLLERGVVPIINENDSVSHDEMRLGDNDRLSALVSVLISADRLVMLSVAPGVLDAAGAVVAEIADVDAARALVRDDRSGTGIGGMATKLDAAAIAVTHGVDTVIAPGDDPEAVGAALRGEPVGTRFPAVADAGPVARKSWIGFSAKVRGTIRVDEGAARALVERGASLLPKGVTAVEGEFGQGAAVAVVGPDGIEIARGLIAYPAPDARRIAGLPAASIEEALGYRYADELIHRDDLLVLGASPREHPPAERNPS